MPKTGYKYTKTQPAKDTTHRLTRSNASSKPNRLPPKGHEKDRNMRSAATIARLRMYTSGKAVRNKEGKIVGGQYMMKDRAGDTKITGSTGRIHPDRRWFGNTHVVTSTQLDVFREEMKEKISDPYSVLLRRKNLPMGLLKDDAVSKKQFNRGLLAVEPFERTFGKKASRKRVKLEQLLVAREGMDDPKDASNVPVAPIIPLEGTAHVVTPPPETDQEGYSALLSAAQRSAVTYDTTNTREGIVPWGRDAQSTTDPLDWRPARPDDLFLKGQSKRIWGEFFKVVDCSDVLLHVIDARNVPGTRCTMIEKHVSKHASHKHLVFVLNKIDLIPKWAAKRWMGILSAVRPTIGFHASLTHAFGKGALISLLRQFGKLHSERKQISVGVIGYPNVGKSSVINTLISKPSCNVAPIPGETKIWQYIMLFRNVYLIDCPGVVVNTAGDTETDLVLKGAVRSEKLDHPQEFIEDILRVVKKEHVAAQYDLQAKGEHTWNNANDLLEKIAKKQGRLLKGGEPCRRSAAISIINNFQRGRLPHFVAPPELIVPIEQNDKGDEDPDVLGEEQEGLSKNDDTNVSVEDDQKDDSNVSLENVLQNTTEPGIEEPIDDTQ